MRKLFACCISLFFVYLLFCQENYEIQVYGSKTMDKGSTIFELHSNFTFSGEKNISDHVLPSHHSLHETLEITHGITDIFELGFYLFTNYTPGYGYKVVGSHIRPRVMVPEKWKWPVGVSLSTEFGYQRREYSEDTWNIEVRPIVDKQAGNFYFSFNPTFGIGLKPDSNNHTPSFEPNFKASYTVNKVALGLEYYGDIGMINDIPEISQQQHTLFLVADFYFDPRWEINVGPGFGLTNAGDNFIFKLLVGRRINWKKK
jgi:outer membrane putative beta-barrel porin/alpha-amylase